MEKISIRFRGSFSPATSSVIPTRDSSPISLTADSVSRVPRAVAYQSYLCDDVLEAHSKVVEFYTCQPGFESVDPQNARTSCPLSVKIEPWLAARLPLWFKSSDSCRMAMQTHALNTVCTISFVNLSRLCSLDKPSSAPPSSIRSHRNWHKTWICCRERYLAGREEMTATRYDTARERIFSSASLIYSLRDWTSSIRVVCRLSSSSGSANRQSRGGGGLTLGSRLCNFGCFELVALHRKHIVSRI